MIKRYFYLLHETGKQYGPFQTHPLDSNCVMLDSEEMHMHQLKKLGFCLKESLGEQEVVVRRKDYEAIGFELKWDMFVDVVDKERK